LRGDACGRKKKKLYHPSEGRRVIFTEGKIATMVEEKSYRKGHHLGKGGGNGYRFLESFERQSPQKGKGGEEKKTSG